jgi:hypothetical protein
MSTSLTVGMFSYLEVWLEIRLKQDVLKLHHRADDWKAVRGQVRNWLAQFKDGAQRLLEHVGLLDNGRLAQIIHGP